MAANTILVIRKSTANGNPGTLKQGEFGFSYLSNTLFIGNTAGTGILNVGGPFYTSTLDSATSSNTASTLVKRDVNGAFQGTANNASTLATPQNFAITGGDITSSIVAFNGSAGVTLLANLTSIAGLVAGSYGGSSAIPVINVGANGRILSISTTAISAGLVAGSYGGSSAIPVINVGANGRILSISTTAISAGSTFNVNANTGGSQVVAAGNTLTLQAGSGSGLTTTASANGGGAQVVFNVDTTILRSNTNAGVQTISSDLILSGNVTILQSNIQSFNIQSTTILAGDSLLQLASNNIVGDVVDIGFYGTSNVGTTVYHGLIREGTGGTSPGNFYLFKNLPTNPTSNVISYATAIRANLVANVTQSLVSNLIAAIAVSDGGTGSTSFTTGTQVIYNGAQFVSIANVASAGFYGSASVIPIFSLDAYGRTLTASNVAIAIAASQITSGTVSIAQGGTNSSSFTNNTLNYYNGTSIVSLANTTGGTGYGSASVVPTFVYDNFGRVVSAANVAIAISAAAITSGTLAIAQGGTNSGSFASNTLNYFNGTSIVSLANVAYTATGTPVAANTLTSLTVDNYGRVSAATFAAISGLTVPQGGTGFATATTNGMIFGNAAGALGFTAAAGTSDQTFTNQLMTVNASGVPVWATTLDGGTF